MTDLEKKEALLTKREKFAERFLEYPIIYFFVRAWLISWRARIVIALSVLLVLGVVLGLPAVWRTTPSDFQPEIRVSLLDEIKARVLERNAKKYLAQGRTDYGIMAYRASISHNRGNLPRQRAFLAEATKRQLEKGRVEMDSINVFGLQTAFWVNKMSQTPDDLALIASFFDAMEFDTDVLALLEKDIKYHPANLKKMYAKALLRQGYIENFEVLWLRESPKGEWETDPEMKLYRAAATAGFGPVDKGIAAGDLLKAQLLDGPQKILANRLFELVSLQRRQIDDYMACLQRLEEWRADRLIDHARAWQLLAATGRKAEALQRADQFNSAPRTALETSQLAAAYTDLGMTKDAIKLLDQYIQRFGFLERLWIQQSSLLVKSEDWVGLRQLIARMRLDIGVAHRMEGFSYYLEGRSALGENRPAVAREAFLRIPQFGIPNLEVAFEVIDEMHKLGHLDITAKLIEQVEESARENPRYWLYVAQLSAELKDEDLLLKATEQYARLRPDDPTAKNNLAAGFLTARRRPSDAVKLTMDLLSRAPEASSFQINHASALSLNARHKEAEELLMNVDLTRLDGSDKTMFYFSLAESLAGQEKYSQARAAAGKVEERFLFPRQVEALNQWRAKAEQALNPNGAAEAGAK
jgi:hypothetical protein